MRKVEKNCFLWETIWHLCGWHPPSLKNDGSASRPLSDRDRNGDKKKSELELTRVLFCQASPLSLNPPSTLHRCFLA